MNILLLAILPIITALIGWVTNYVAIKMLFRPRNPINLFGFKIQGMIPKRQMDIAARAAELIESEILSQHIIKNEILKINMEPYILEISNKLVHQGIGMRLQAMPLIGGFINESTLKIFENIMNEEMSKEVVPLAEKIAGECESQLDINYLVKSQIEKLDLINLEQIVRKIAAKEFKTIEYLGGFLGFVVGILQLVILLYIK